MKNSMCLMVFQKLFVFEVFPKMICIFDGFVSPIFCICDVFVSPRWLCSKELTSPVTLTTTHLASIWQ